MTKLPKVVLHLCSVYVHVCLSLSLCDDMSWYSLQQKVQQCLDDGVRLPMLDLKHLEAENTRLLEQQDHSSRVTF